jgi:transcriptional regulator with XRE-family HTH domain
MKKITARLLDKFHDFVYRHTYIDEFVDAYIATQIKVLREQRDWNQTVLAEKAGLHQSQIVTYEDVNNASWTLRTLKKLAKAFDLVLVVRFESFGKVLPEIGHLERERLIRESFSDDPVFSSRLPLTDEGYGQPPQKVARVLNATAKFSRQDIAGFSEDVPNVA